MDEMIEQKIVNAFLVKRKRERALFELSKPDKRRSFIWKIDLHFRPEVLERILLPIDTYRDVLGLLRQNGASEQCYLLSIFDDLDGQMLSLDEGVKKAVFSGRVLVSCVHGKVAYYEGEPGCGAPYRHILRSESPLE